MDLGRYSECKPFHSYTRREPSFGIELISIGEDYVQIHQDSREVEE